MISNKASIAMQVGGDGRHQRRRTEGEPIPPRGGGLSHPQRRPSPSLRRSTYESSVISRATDVSLGEPIPPRSLASSHSTATKSTYSNRTPLIRSHRSLAGYTADSLAPSSKGSAFPPPSIDSGRPAPQYLQMGPRRVQRPLTTPL